MPWLAAPMALGAQVEWRNGAVGPATGWTACGTFGFAIRQDRDGGTAGCSIRATLL
jgi:hypothetical protein